MQHMVIGAARCIATIMKKALRGDAITARYLY